MPAATAAALPPELPPADLRSETLNGFTTGPWIECTFRDLMGQVRKRSAVGCWSVIPHTKFIAVGLPYNVCTRLLEKLNNCRVER